MNNEPFTLREALALVGHTFEVLIEFSGVSQGTRGRVVSCDSGHSQADPAGAGYDVVIEWQFQHQAPAFDETQIGGERVLMLHAGQPLRDWFTKSELERFMREV